MSDNLVEYLRWSMRLLKANDSWGRDGVVECQQDAEKGITQAEYDDAQRILAIIDEELV